MKRLIAFTFAVAFGVAAAGTVSASLWDFYQERGQALPSLEERAIAYSEIASDEYVGSERQNQALEDYLRGNVGGFDFGFGGDELLGASTLPVAGTTYNLAGSGITSSATSITLQSLTIPQTGYKLQDSDFSATFYITLEPGSRTRQEIASCTTVTQNGNGTATLSGCERGLTPFTPFTASSTYRFSHAGGTSVIFSDPPQLFNEFSSRLNEESIERVWTFDAHPTASSSIGTPTTTYQYVTKEYADNLVNQGAATSTESNAGIIEQATVIEMASSTQFDVNNPHAINSEHATSTPTHSCDSSGTSGALCLPVAENDGKLNQGWLDLSETWAFSSTSSVTIGGNTFNASSTANAIPISDGDGFLDSDYFPEDVFDRIEILVTAGEYIPVSSTVPQAVYFNTYDDEWFQTDATAASTTFSFRGFATEDGEDGEEVAVIHKGVVPGFSGLTPGAHYYLTDTAGEISTTPGTTQFKVGVAISASKLLIDEGPRTMSYSYDDSVNGTGTWSENSDTEVITGFRPTRIFGHVVAGDNNDIYFIAPSDATNDTDRQGMQTFVSWVNGSHIGYEYNVNGGSMTTNSETTYWVDYHNSGSGIDEDAEVQVISVSDNGFTIRLHGDATGSDTLYAAGQLIIEG